jgi:hypothetical protein
MSNSDVEAAHEVSPGWSVLYDNYRCRTCGLWVYRESATGQWKHGGAGE